MPQLHDVNAQDDDLVVLVSTMNTLIAKLEMQEKDRADFTASISHDLRTPITSINGFITGMLDGIIPPDRYDHYLAIVKQETMRLKNLVQTLFDLSTMQQAGVLSKTAFDLNRLIEDDIAGQESMMKDKSIRLTLDLARDGRNQMIVIGDREALSRVVYNVLANAIKFTPHGGRIDVSTSAVMGERHVTVFVEDNGPGIAVDERPYIFDRFYMVDKSRTDKGAGLGLYIARTILSAHGQRISVEESQYGGACFRFTLERP